MAFGNKYQRKLLKGESLMNTPKPGRVVALPDFNPDMHPIVSAAKRGRYDAQAGIYDPPHVDMTLPRMAYVRAWREAEAMAKHLMENGGK